MKAQKKYLEMEKDPEANSVEVSSLRNDYYFWLEKFKKSQRGKIVPYSKQLEKMSTDLSSSSSVVDINKEDKKELIDFSTPVDKKKSDNKPRETDNVFQNYDN